MVFTETGKSIEVRTYIGAPIRVTPKRVADSAAFILILYEIQYDEADKSGLEALIVIKDREDRTVVIITDI